MSQFYNPGSDQMAQDSSYSFDMDQYGGGELNFQNFPGHNQQQLTPGNNPNLGYDSNPYLNPMVSGSSDKPQGGGGEFEDEPPLLEGAVPSLPTPTAQTIRHNWYQTETQLVVDALIKQANPDTTRVNITKDRVEVTVSQLSTQQSSSTQHVLKLNLAHPINPDASSFRVLGTKIEIKLAKTADERWNDLEAKVVPPPAQTSKNWDAVARQIEDEKKEGEAALNELFQKIYGEGSDEVRRAMNKSFVESGGTVLSTNWDEVRRKEVDVKPPEGLEYKKWDA